MRRPDLGASWGKRHGLPAGLSGVARRATTAGAIAGAIKQVPAHYLACVAICQPRETTAYLPLLLSFGVVDDGEPVPVGGVLDEDGFVSGDELVEGGVPDDVDVDPVPVDGVVVSGVVEDEEPDDIEPLGVVEVDGVIVDDDDDVDGDGVTTGGVVSVVGVDVSRLQPATPRTSPVQSSVTNAVFIAISIIS